MSLFPLALLTIFAITIAIATDVALLMLEFLLLLAGADLPAKVCRSSAPSKVSSSLGVKCQHQTV